MHLKVTPHLQHSQFLGTHSLYITCLYACLLLSPSELSRSRPHTYPVVGSICTAEKYTVTVAGDARSKRKLDFTLIIVHRTRTFSAVLLPQTVHGPAIPTVIRPLSPALTPCSRCPHYRAARIVTGTRKYDCGPTQLLLCHLH